MRFGGQDFDRMCNQNQPLRRSKCGEGRKDQSPVQNSIAQARFSGGDGLERPAVWIDTDLRNPGDSAKQRFLSRRIIYVAKGSIRSDSHR